VTIHNQGDHSYAISMPSIALRVDKSKDVAWKYHKGSIARRLMIPSTIDSFVSFKKK
jgi:hypothetical protein